MVKRQFIGFQNKVQLKTHLKKHFSKSKIVKIGDKKILKGVTKTTPPTTSYMVTLKEKKRG